MAAELRKLIKEIEGRGFKVGGKLLGDHVRSLEETGLIPNKLSPAVVLAGEQSVKTPEAPKIYPEISLPEERIR